MTKNTQADITTEPSQPQLPKPFLRWLALVSLSLCLAMSFIDQNGIPLALPTLQKYFHSNIHTLNWVINAYWLPIALFCLVTGIIADYCSKRLLLIIGLVVFAGASIFCALANSIEQLIIARFIQGLGAATLIPMTSALLPSLFDNKQLGQASGSLASCGALAAIFGPILVGAILTHSNWHWIFIINLPLSLIVIIAVCFLIPKSSPDITTTKLEKKYCGLVPFILMASSFCLWIIQLPDSGIAKASQIILSISGLFFLSIFIWQSKYKKDKFFIRPQLLENKYYCVVTLLGALTKMRSAVGIYALPFFFQIILHLSPLRTGFIMVPSLIAVMLFGAASGKLSDKYGPRLPFFIGSLSSIIAWCGFLFSTHININLLYVLCFINGAGNVMMIPVSISQSLKSTPRYLHGAASGLGTMTRQLLGLIGVIMITGISTHILGSGNKSTHLAHNIILSATKAGHALHAACAICLVISFVQIILIIFMPKKATA